MELAGMVAMVQYSEGCICQQPNLQKKQVSQTLFKGASSIAAGSSDAVEIQMLRAEQSKNAAMMTGGSVL